MQIRTRLTIQFILITAGILLAAFVYIRLQYKTILLNDYYESLKSKSLIIADMVAGRIDDESNFAIQDTAQSATLLGGTYSENISIYNINGDRLYSFNPAPVPISLSVLMHIKMQGEYRFNRGKSHALGVVYTNRVGTSYIIIGESVFDQVHIRKLTTIMIVVFFMAITLVAGAGWVFARQALAPVSRIMNQVDALLPTDMSHRLAEAGSSDELSRLVITFNKLLDRIQRVFQTQKMFMSNISHELKNQMNVITSQIEVILQQDRTCDAYRETLQSTLYDVREMNDVADKLMQLARIHANDSAIKFQPVRVDEIIWQSKETLLKTYPGYKIQFEVENLPEDESAMQVICNESLLKSALVNLLENGCKFSAENQVKIRLSFTADNLPVIAITDNGYGIPEAEIPHIFSPFYRSPHTSGIKGSGIGLSLVDTILSLHKISIDVNSRLGSGTIFTLKFPGKPFTHRVQENSPA